MKDQDSHPYKETDINIVNKFYQRRRKPEIGITKVIHQYKSRYRKYQAEVSGSHSDEYN
jgi:hypothetical protein